MPELVAIPIAAVEVAIDYESPSMKLIMDRANVVDRLFKSFKRWDLRIDDVEIINDGKPSEQGIRFKLPLKRTSFFFGAGGCKLVRDAASWDTAEETLAILETGWSILVEAGGVSAGQYRTNIALHMQLKNKSFVELLKPFVPLPFLNLEDSPITAVAAVIRWDGRRITIDGSGQIANGIFVRLERDFPGYLSFSDVARQLRADEDQVFDIIGVKEDI
jgi:hypothetical protein